MATQIIMPKLGMAMSEGVVAKWEKRDGDHVEKDEVVAVIMSKKITYKMVAPQAGVLRIVAREKETRAVGAVIGFVTAPGEAVPAVEGVAPVAAAAVEAAAPTGAATAAPAQPKTGFVLASPAARRIAKEKAVDLHDVKGTGVDGMVSEADVLHFVEESALPAVAAPPAAPAAEVLATSAARRLAEQQGIDLARIHGTGPGGRITEQDVSGYAAGPGSAPAAAPAVPAPAPAGSAIPFSGMRQAIAEHMVDSLQTMAQLTMTAEVDVTELVKLRTQLKEEFELTYTDLLVKAVAKGLKRHPILNSTLTGDEIQMLPAIHIGVAVALPDGLIVPVVRDADTRTVPEIAQEVRRLAQGARAGNLSVDEVTGSTFTITNLGNYGIDSFTPIINAPEVAILGVGRIVEKPVIYNDQIARRWLLVLSLTVDHRIVDGAPAADFMKTLSGLLEKPYQLLI